MSIVSAIWNLIKKIFSAVLGWLSDIFGKYFLIILALVIIWFAPMISAWLVSVGAPAFMVAAVDAIAVLTPYLQTAGQWLWKGGSSMLTSAWQAFKGAEVGTQAAIVLGAAAAIAPEETAVLLGEVVDTAGTLLGAVASSSRLGWLAVGIGAYLFFFRDSNNDGERTAAAGAGA